VTGDDIGAIKVWNSRTIKTTHIYPETHTDHITSFLPLPSVSSHHVLSTSGDCTLSIFDLRKSVAVISSEDQEDELLCSAYADDSRRVITGTQSDFITVWKSGEWLDHIDRISPAERVRKGDEAPSIDCLVKGGDGVFAGSSDGVIRRVGFRPNQYLDIIGKCELGVSALAAIPEMEGWIVSASGSKIAFWDTNAPQNEQEEDSSEEEEKLRKKRRKRKKGKKSTHVEESAFFADL
jgi:WD repeat-containing protein 55